MNATSYDTCTDIQMVFERKVRAVPGMSYDVATRTTTDVVRGQFYATVHLAYVGREVDGSWTFFTIDGAPIVSNLPNKTAAKLAARRHFGPVIVC